MFSASGLMAVAASARKRFHERDAVAGNAFGPRHLEQRVAPSIVRMHAVAQARQPALRATAASTAARAAAAGVSLFFAARRATPRSIP
jgi:hypothetical protein